MFLSVFDITGNVNLLLQLSSLYTECITNGNDVMRTLVISPLRHSLCSVFKSCATYL